MTQANDNVKTEKNTKAGTRKVAYVEPQQLHTKFVYTIEDMCELLDTSRIKVRNMARAGSIPRPFTISTSTVTKPGARLYWLRETVEAHLREWEKDHRMDL